MNPLVKTTAVLPTVMAGMVNAPILAMPISVGDVTSFGGVAALLGILRRYSRIGTETDMCFVGFCPHFHNSEHSDGT